MRMVLLALLAWSSLAGPLFAAYAEGRVTGVTKDGLQVVKIRGGRVLKLDFSERLKKNEETDNPSGNYPHGIKEVGVGDEIEIEYLRVGGANGKLVVTLINVVKKANGDPAPPPTKWAKPSKPKKSTANDPEPPKKP